MRGRLRDLVPRPSVSIPSVPRPSGRTRMYGILGFVVIVWSISAAGILSGLGLFLLAMLSAKPLVIGGSSLLLSFSIAVFLVCYMWLTA